MVASYGHRGVHLDRADGKRDSRASLRIVVEADSQGRRVAQSATELVIRVSTPTVDRGVGHPYATSDSTDVERTEGRADDRGWDELTSLELIAVAKPPLVVRAPAIRQTFIDEAATALVAGAHRVELQIAEPEDSNRTRAWKSGNAIAELAKESVAPAVHKGFDRCAARVRSSGAHRGPFLGDRDRAEEFRRLEAACALHHYAHRIFPA
jgi:hypothetical protein